MKKIFRALGLVFMTIKDDGATGFQGRGWRITGAAFMFLIVRKVGVTRNVYSFDVR